MKLAAAVAATAVLAGCSTTQARLCTWPGANGEQLSIVGVEYRSAEIDVEAVGALANIVGNATLRTGRPADEPNGAAPRSASPPELPAVCADLFT